MIKLIVIWLIIVVLVVALMAGVGNKQLLKSLGINFKLWGAYASAKIDYQEERNKEGNNYNYKVNFNTPVGTKVILNTLSPDTVAVTSVTQEGEKTHIILEPVDNKTHNK